MPRRRNREEERIHRAVADWLRVNDVYFTHVPNEEGNALQRQIKAGLGTLPGVSDILIFDPPPAAPGLMGTAVEIKALGKRPTKAQVSFLVELDRRLWATHWFDDLDTCLAWLRSLGYGKREKRTTPPARGQRGLPSDPQKEGRPRQPKRAATHRPRRRR